MKRLLVNASPRGRRSNSRIILSWAEEGLASAGAEPCETADLVPLPNMKSLNAKIIAAQEILIAFPLYTDSVPGVVKALIESWEGMDFSGKRLAWIVQSGFPESIQSETVARYLARLTRRMGAENGGIAIKGGIEGIQIQPESMTRRLRASFSGLGESLERDGRFDPALAERLAKPRRLSRAALLGFRLLSLTGITNFYWNMMLKRNGAYDKRFDAPYGEKFSG